MHVHVRVTALKQTSEISVKALYGRQMVISMLFIIMERYVVRKLVVDIWK